MVEGEVSQTLSIAHLIASNFFGGPDKQIVELSRRLVARGWPHSIGSFREQRERVEILDQAAAAGLPTFLLDTSSPFSPAAVGQLRRALRDCGAQLLVTHGYKSTLVGRLATQGSDVRQLPFVRGFTAENARVRLYERIDRLVLRGFPTLVAVSAGTREMLVRHGLRRERICVLHNAVDCGVPVTPVDLRREFSLPAESFVLVAAGRLSPEKGHRYLVSAMAQIVRQEARAVAVILGSGSQQAALESQIAQEGLGAQVVLVGFRRDALACLAGATLVVNPSLSEGLPNVVLEALSLAVPVVATAVGGVGELIEHGRDGWLVPAGDPAALGASILGALADAPLRARVAATGRARVEREFSFDRQRENFEAICARVMRGSGADHAAAG